jgi:hypothetical protein
MPTARENWNEYHRNRRRALPQDKKDKLDAISRKRCAEWYSRNKERTNARATKWRHSNREWETLNVRLRCYGLTLDQFHAIYERQDFSCAICGKDDVKLVIDHCHSTGIVRGLLCTRCNVGLGIFGDSVEQIHRGVAYLQKYAS